MKISEIFTPNDTPTVTYVGREELNLEKNLQNYCNLPKMVVSVSGPSKSGKTVLINKVLKDDRIIRVIGSGISSPEDLWNRTLQKIGVTLKETEKNTSSTSVSGSVTGGGELGVPLVTKGKAEGTTAGEKSWTKESTHEIGHEGLTCVINEVANTDHVIFLDDFHYINEEHRQEIGRQIKVAADNGVKIIAASVPHRTDDVVRSNPELRGRVAAVDVGFWEQHHLTLIVERGFDALEVDLEPKTVSRLCAEAMGSPQLMQTICFCLCQTLDISEEFKERNKINLTEDHISDALFQTSHFTDFSKMLSSLHSGPKARGQERKEHALIDGSIGDVYRSVLLAIRSDPISTSFTYDDIVTRVKSVCVDSSPVGSSVTSCLEQMHSISEQLQPGNPVLVWDGDNLDITDPYFAFFLRSSDKLRKMGNI